MKEIIAAVGAALFFLKGINLMTEQSTDKNIWFRVFRAVFWSGLAVLMASIAFVAVAYAYHAIIKLI